MNRILQQGICLGALALGTFFSIAGVAAPAQKHTQENNLSHHHHKGKTYVVTTTADSGTGSLRDIINRINAKGSNALSAIRFDIPRSDASSCDGKKCYVIQPGSATGGLPLPTIYYPVKINGRNRDKGIVELDGQFATVSTISALGVPTALALMAPTANGSTIQNLVFSDFPVDIYLNGVDDTKISCNFFMTDVINQSSIVGTSISNFISCQNTFVTTATDTNGIFLTNPTGKIKVKKSTFSGFSEVTSAANGNGVFVVLNNGATLDALEVSRSSFSNFSNPPFGAGGAGINVTLDGTGGTLNNFIVSDSTFSNMKDNSAGVFAYVHSSSGTINNWTVQSSTFSNLNASFGIATFFDASGNIGSIAVSDCTFSNLNGSDCIGLYPQTLGATLDNATVSNCTFSNLTNRSDAINPYVFQGTLGNLAISNCTFNSLTDHGTAVNAVSDTGGLIDNISVTDSTINDISSISPTHAVGVAVQCFNSGIVNNANILDSTFNGISNSGAVGINLNIMNGGTFENTNILRNTFNNSSDDCIVISLLNFGTPSTNVRNNIDISKNTFNGISQGAIGISTLFTNFTQVPGEFNNWNITKNRFNDIADTSIGIDLQLLLSAPSNLNVSQNTFTGATATIDGYASTINLLSGNVCLSFRKNVATPSTTPAPFVLENSGGTFSRTAGSDNTTNTGAFDIIGVVGAPGSCSF